MKLLLSHLRVQLNIFEEQTERLTEIQTKVFYFKPFLFHFQMKKHNLSREPEYVLLRYEFSPG